MYVDCVYGDLVMVCRLCDGMLHNIPSHNLHTQHTITQSTCMLDCVSGMGLNNYHLSYAKML